MSVIFVTHDELRRLAQQSGFRVKSLAAHMDVDVRTLQRWFGAHLSTTPKAWLTGERINASLPLVRRGLPNKCVAALLGFSSAASFGRDFRNHFGCTPQEYRHGILSPRRRSLVSRFDHSVTLSDSRDVV